MLSKEDNDLLTLTGPGTLGGDMLRRYWHPVGLCRELEGDVPMAVTVLGEDLVLFRDDRGRAQLIGRSCPHRRTDLSYGRVEDGGLRCLYHGWLLSGDGRCLAQPGEPADSTFKHKIKHTAYPCVEAGGLIMAYMGGGTPPRLPNFEFFNAPIEHAFTIKVHHACNYLQGNEGNLDPQHLSYLHRFLSKDLLQRELNTLVVNDPAPELDVQATAFGLRIFASRSHRPGRRFVRTTNFIMPNAATFHGSPVVNPAKLRHDENLAYQLHWHVPIDDHEHWKYTVAFRFDGPVDWDFQRNVQFRELPDDFCLPRHRANRFKQDREEMRHESFSGLGKSFYVHDKFATEAQGVIMDRTDEHLGTTDRAIIMARRMLLDAIEDVRAGRDPLFVERDGQPFALDEMFVKALDISSDVDLASDWWREYPKSSVSVS